MQKQRLSVRVDETVTAEGAATVTVELQTATDAAFTSPVVLATSRAIPKATLVQGAQAFYAVVPRGCLQFLRLYYTVGTGPLTAGKFTAALSLDGMLGAQEYRTGLGARV